jgi:endoglucanase
MPLLPTGHLSTSGSQIVDEAGTPIRICAVGWNQGFGDIPGTVKAMVAAGFNACRLSYVNANLAVDLARIDEIVAAAQAVGLKVIIDHHTCEMGSAADGWGAPICTTSRCPIQTCPRGVTAIPILTSS